MTLPSTNENTFIYDSAIGRLLFSYEDKPFRLVRVNFANVSAGRKRCGEIPAAAGGIIEWFDAYFGRRPSTTPWEFLKIDGFTPLQQAVWAAASEIGFGALATYADLAHAIGRPRAPRFVGNALGKNPFPILIPCHRIVRSDGGLGGFTGGLSIKKSLMAFELSCNHPMLAH